MIFYGNIVIVVYGKIVIFYGNIVIVVYGKIVIFYGNIVMFYAMEKL